MRLLIEACGISVADLGRHIAWDVGAARTAQRLAERLDAPLLMQRYSRLVIDCNRPPESPLAIPVISDGTLVPANRDMTADERKQRVDEIFRPCDNAVAELLDAVPRTLTLAIHSFTPVFGGIARPWHIGFVYRHDQCTSSMLAESIRTAAPSVEIGLNQSYQIDDATDWFVPQHAEPRGLAHSLIEIRNDELSYAAGCDRWADRLATAIRQLVPRSG